MNEETKQKEVIAVYSKVRRFPGRDGETHKEPNSAWPVSGQIFLNQELSNTNQEWHPLHRDV
jgi:hypothetical protein